MFRQNHLDKPAALRGPSPSRSPRLWSAMILASLLLGPQSAAAMTSGPETSMTASPASDPETEASRRALEGFIELVGKGDVQGAVERYASPSYTQHMPGVTPGRDGAVAYIQSELARGGRASIIKVIAQGKLVALHMRQTFTDGSPDREIIEMWRVENGKLAEHWGVGVDLPKDPAS